MKKILSPIVDILSPIATEAVKWVKEKIGPSKKDIRIEISELKEKIKELSYGQHLTEVQLSSILNCVIESLNNNSKCEIKNNVINIFVYYTPQKSHSSSTIFSKDDEEIEKIKKITNGDVK